MLHSCHSMVVFKAINLVPHHLPTQGAKVYQQEACGWFQGVQSTAKLPNFEVCNYFFSWKNVSCCLCQLCSGKGKKVKFVALSLEVSALSRAYVARFGKGICCKQNISGRYRSSVSPFLWVLCFSVVTTPGQEEKLGKVKTCYVSFMLHLV